MPHFIFIQQISVLNILNTERKTTLERSRHKWENTIKTDLNKLNFESVDCINFFFFQNRRILTYLSKFCTFQSSGNALNHWATISCSLLCMWRTYVPIQRDMKGNHYWMSFFKLTCWTSWQGAVVRTRAVPKVMSNNFL